MAMTFIGRPAAQETLTPALQEGESFLFEKSPPFVMQRDQTPALICMLTPIPTIMREASLSEAEGERYPFLSPALADLYSRRLLGIGDEELGSRADKDELRAFRDVEEIFDDVARGEASAKILANLAFQTVLFRPPGLVVPASRIHASDFNHPDVYFADRFRHRVNFLRRIGEGAQVKRSDVRYLGMFGIGAPGYREFTNRQVMEYFADDRARSEPKTVEVLARMSLGHMARSFLPLAECGPEYAETLRNRFIERGYEVFEDLDNVHQVGEDLFHIDSSDEASRHILKGDKIGGGHHIPSLDPKFARVVGDVELISGGIRGSEQQVPVARVLRFDGQGELRTDRVAAFFPSDWSPEKVLKSITDPARLVVSRDLGHKREEYFHINGVLLERIVTQYMDADDVLVTAYPAVTIPPDVQNRLKGRN